MAMEDLGGSAQLQILDIVCCKVFDDFLCDAGEDGMVCGDLMDDPKQQKNLSQGPLPCMELKIMLPLLMQYT